MSFRSTRRPPVITALFSCVMGLVMIGVVLLGQPHLDAGVTVTLPGEVIEVREIDPRGRVGLRYTPVIRYRLPNGDMQTFVAGATSNISTTWQVGQTVNILVDPARPETATLPFDHTLANPALMIAFAAGLLLLCTGAYWLITYVVRGAAGRSERHG